MDVKYIGICGTPGAGKSTVQQMLVEEFGVAPVDDGFPLRAFAVNHFGATWKDVSSQEGKLRTTVICGKTYTWRQVLGELGNALEAKFGEQAIPEMAIRMAQSMEELDERPAYSFGSVRKTQGKTYREAGGVVIEVANSAVRPTGNGFDVYAREYVSHIILNDSGSLDVLRGQVRRLGLELGLNPVHK